MGPTDILYLCVVLLIRCLKWVELQVLKLFHPLTQQFVVEELSNIGVLVEMCDKNGKVVETLGRNKTNMKTETIRINDKSYFPLTVCNGFMGVGEAYMNKLWDCDNLVELTRRFLRSGGFRTYFHPYNRFLNYLEMSAFNMQTPARSWEVIKKHYDLGNDLYEAFLDPWMQYTCAYWPTAKNLNEASLAKLDLIARKLDLKPGMRVLDLGCGWGTLSKYLAQNYGVECVGVTISQEGLSFAKKICEGLPVEFRLTDYRNMVKGTEKFDRVVAIGLIEHVGWHNYKSFFQVADHCLKDDGIFLIQCIGFADVTLPRTEPWLGTYIFPNGSVPFDTDIVKNVSGKWVIEDWHNFGRDYAKTVEAWYENFCNNWPTLSLKYGSRFKRMWDYYMLQSQGFFLSRKAHLWQLVLSKNGLEYDYRAAR